MADIGLAEESGGGEIGRPRPNLDRVGAALQPHDELVVGNLGQRALVGDALVVDRKPGRLHGAFVRGLFRIRRVVIDDLDVDTLLDQRTQRVEDRGVGELIGRDAKRIAGFGLVDVFKTGFQQTARQPFHRGIVGVVDILRRLVVKLLGVFLASDRTAVEPNPVRFAVRPLLLGPDLEPDGVLAIGSQRAGRAVHRLHYKAVQRIRGGRIVAPEKALHGEFVGVERRRLVRMSGIMCLLGVGHDRLEDLLRAQIARAPAVRADYLALEGEAFQAFAPGFGAIERDQDRVRAGNRLGLEIAVAPADAHALLPMPAAIQAKVASPPGHGE